MFRRRGLFRELPKLKSSNHFVAYIDIDTLNEVILTNVVSNKDIYLKIFSDNILIAIKTTKDDKNRQAKLEKIINLTGNFYNNILRHGYLARGAITEGLFYNDENNIFVYGKALTDAVTMEEENAIYPRIIVKKEIRDLFPQYFLESNDYFYTLNAFLFLELFDMIIYKQHLINYLQKFKKDNKIKQKIMWIINYFNKFNETKKMQGSVLSVLITKEEITNALNSTKKAANANK